MEMEVILGTAMFYSWIHFMFIQHNKSHNERTNYEKAVSIFALVAFVMYLFGSL